MFPGAFFNRMLLFVEAGESWADRPRPSRISPLETEATKSVQGGRIDVLSEEQRNMFAAYIELLRRQATNDSISQNDMEQASGRVRDLILEHLRRFTKEHR